MLYWTALVLVAVVLTLLRRGLAMSWKILPQWLAPMTSQAVNPSQPSEKAAEPVEPDDPSVKDELSDSASTPKAKPTEAVDEVPTFSLSSPREYTHEEKREASNASSETKPSSQASHRPKVSSTVTQAPATMLMPPPSGPLPSHRGPAPSAAASLRVPSSGPLPNRGPPGNSQQRASGGLSPNDAVPTPNPRGKVLLSPGHSPMDWAALTRSGNLAGVNTFQRVTPSQLRSMTGRKGKPAWSSWQGKVYNITPYLPFHPGGEGELMKAAGRDGTKLFMESHPWVNWDNMLGSCLVGVMVPEDYAQSSLEDMD